VVQCQYFGSTVAMHEGGA